MPKARRVPQRTCVGCGEVEGKRALLRIVRSTDGTLALDVTGKRNGRGAYVHRDADCFQRAASGRLLRALRAEGAGDQLPALRQAFSELLATPASRAPTTHRAEVPLPEHLIARNRRGPTRTPGRRGDRAAPPGRQDSGRDPRAEEGDRDGEP